jgi:FkbM family methyltransferase
MTVSGAAMVYNEIEKNIYNRLQDDESRELFDCRLRWYRLCENTKNPDVNTLVDELINVRERYHLPDNNKGLLNFLQNYKNGKFEKSPVLYGAGAGGAEVISYLRKSGIMPRTFVDRQASRTGYFGVGVISPETLLSQTHDDPLIISTVLYHYTVEIYEFLKKNRYDENMIWSAYTNIEPQYFCSDFITPKTNEIFVDCGAYNGDTFTEFLNFTGGKFTHYYAFEADKVLCENENVKAVFSKYSNSELINSAVSDESGYIGFDSGDHTGNGSVGGDVLVKTVRIDDVCPDATFIKMDIEGSELAALRGAAETIKRNKPRLAICIYHKPEDITEIPSYILTLCPDYKFFIRHHSFGQNETVLYAV